MKEAQYMPELRRRFGASVFVMEAPTVMRLHNVLQRASERAAAAGFNLDAEDLYKFAVDVVEEAVRWPALAVEVECLRRTAVVDGVKRKLLTLCSQAPTMPAATETRRIMSTQEVIEYVTKADDRVKVPPPTLPHIFFDLGTGWWRVSPMVKPYAKHQPLWDAAHTHINNLNSKRRP